MLEVILEISQLVLLHIFLDTHSHRIYICISFLQRIDVFPLQDIPQDKEENVLFLTAIELKFLVEVFISSMFLKSPSASPPPD